jgi:hypothetical protein
MLAPHAHDPHRAAALADRRACPENWGRRSPQAAEPAPEPAPASPQSRAPHATHAAGTGGARERTRGGSSAR